MKNYPFCDTGKLHAHGTLKKEKSSSPGHLWRLDASGLPSWKVSLYFVWQNHHPLSSFPFPLGRLRQRGNPEVLTITQRMSFTASAQLLSLLPGRVICIPARHFNPSWLSGGGSQEMVLTLEELSFRGRSLVCVLGTLAPQRGILQGLPDDRK